jgi:hypothetical protein
MDKVYSDFDTHYGPYTRKDGRKHMVLVQHGEGGGITKKITVSYPKYLVETKFNRVLLPNETVDHIDRDFTNDDFSNLRIIDRSEHVKQDVLKVKVDPIKCFLCETEFTPTVDQMNSRNGDEKAGPFCSRSCTGKYGAMVGNGMEKVKRNKITKTYYREDKNVSEINKI